MVYPSVTGCVHVRSYIRNFYSTTTILVRVLVSLRDSQEPFQPEGPTRGSTGFFSCRLLLLPPLNTSSCDEGRTRLCCCWSSHTVDLVRPSTSEGVSHSGGERGAVTVTTRPTSATVEPGTPVTSHTFAYLRITER